MGDEQPKMNANSREVLIKISRKGAKAQRKTMKDER
jgi:hypothetical protein